jgi:2-iminobutanoate/2-iminopropanoate deaminase
MNAQATQQSPKTFGPYSPVRQAGDAYYISGQIGINPITHTASENPAEQMDQALKNLGNVLASVGLRYAQVVKTTLYLTDMQTFPVVNDVYLGYFSEPRPARSAVGVNDLPHVGGNTKLVVEIDAVAVGNAS